MTDPTPAHLRRARAALGSPCACEEMYGSHPPDCPKVQAVALLLAEAEAERDRLRDWRATVTASLQRPGGAFYADVPEHIRALRRRVAELEGALGFAIDDDWSSCTYNGGCLPDGASPRPGNECAKCRVMAALAGQGGGEGGSGG